jgi:hypothetical protein
MCHLRMPKQSGKLTKVSRKKTIQLRTDGATSLRASIGALWGPKQLDNLVDLDLSFEVMPEKSVLRRREGADVGNQYVFRNLKFPFLTRFFVSRRPVRYVSKVSSLSFPLVPAEQGQIASFSSSMGGRARLQKCKRLSTKFIVHLTPTNPLLSLRTSSCRRVCTWGHSSTCLLMLIGVTLCRFM